MKIKLFSLILLCIIGLSSASAQNPRTILDDAYDAYSKANGAAVKFILDAKDIAENHTFSQHGTIYVRGEKFKLELPEAISWFDGKTQWTYIKNTEEISITNPSEEELQSINPSLLFAIYKQGYDLKYNGDKTIGGKTIQIVEMTAQNKNNNLKKIIVEVNKSDKSFSKIILYDNNGMENTLIINSYKPDSSLNNDIFSFKKSEYPNAEVIDLR